MLNRLLWLHPRTWTIMWWAGRTGTWPWTTLVDRTGLKTTSTAPSSWMHSATSSTSNRLSTAWPTSGSSAGPFVHIDADFTWSMMRTDRSLLSTARSCGRGPRELACLPIRKQTWVTLPSSDRMAQLFSSYLTGTGTVFSCTCGTFPGSYMYFMFLLMFFFCRSSSAVKFEVWDPSVGYIPATAPAHSLLTLAWKTHWLVTPVQPSHIANNQSC